MAARISFGHQNHVFAFAIVGSQQAGWVAVGFNTVVSHSADTLLAGSLLEVSSHRVGVVFVHASLTGLREAQANNVTEVFSGSGWAWAVVTNSWVVVVWKIHLVECTERLHLCTCQFSDTEFRTDW